MQRRRLSRTRPIYQAVLLLITILLQDTIFSSLFFHKCLKGMTIKEKGTSQGKEAFTGNFEERDTANYSNLLFFQDTLKTSKISFSKKPNGHLPQMCAVGLK